MHIHPVSEEEFRLIQEVRNDETLTQRKLSEKTGIALGTVNLILKRLTQKGYIKVKRLNRRNLQYLLTPEGFTEISKRSYRYLLKTINSVRKMKAEIQHLVLEEYYKGKREFIILGDNELADIIELSLKDLDKSNLKYQRASRPEHIRSSKAVILLAQTELDPGDRTSDIGLRTNKYIDVLAAISQN
mgnify:CR=1 FL=1